MENIISQNRNSTIIKIIIAFLILIALFFIFNFLKNYFFPSFPSFDIANKKFIVYGSKSNSSLLGKESDSFQNDIVLIDKNGAASEQKTDKGLYGYIGIANFDSKKVITTFGPRRLLNVKSDGSNSIENLFTTDPYADNREDGQVIGSKLDLLYTSDNWIASSIDSGETFNGSFISYKHKGDTSFKTLQVGLVNVNSMWVDEDMLYYTAFDNNRTSNHIVKYDLANGKEVLNVNFPAEETYIRVGDYSQLYPKVDKINGKFLLTKNNNSIVLLDPETLNVSLSYDIVVGEKNIPVTTNVIDGKIYVSGGVLGVFDFELNPIDAVVYDYTDTYKNSAGYSYPTNAIFKDGEVYDLRTITNTDNSFEVHILESEISGKFIKDYTVLKLDSGTNWDFHVFDVL